MSDYIITVNSTVDTTREWLAERGVPYIPLKYTIDGQTYSDMEGLSSKEFFDKLREGKMSTTSQINPDEAREALEPYLKEGKDILHLSFSSGLSGTCNSMKIAAEELQEEYPERKIIVIDTLCACLGEALLLYYVLKQKENGATIEEAAKWAEENKLHICHDVTVDDLNHLHRGGRVSKTSAVLGTMVQIKPIIIMDDNGCLKVVGKERGRKKSLNKIVDMAAKQAEGYENEIIMITTEGIIIRLQCADISILGRITSGVKLINLSKGVTVASFAKVREKEEDKENQQTAKEPVNEANDEVQESTEE